MAFLLLPAEKVFLRSRDQCFDVLVSGDRGKLLEKFLRPRYTLISEEGSKEISPSLKNNECRLEMQTTKNKKMNSTSARLGRLSSANASSDTQKEISVAQILLGQGKPGELSLEGRTLIVECNQRPQDRYELIFSYSEEFRAKLKSEVVVKKGEALQIGQIINDLNQKSRTLGLPQSQYMETQGQENISYELKVN